MTNTLNLSFHFNFTCLSKVNLSFLVLVSLALCHSLNQGCKLSIKRFMRVLSIKCNAMFLIPFRRVSTSISFPLDNSSKRCSCVQSFDSFKADEIQLNVTKLKLLVFVARLRKKRIILWRIWRKLLRKLK